jgi:hypothetical protein
MKSLKKAVFSYAAPLLSIFGLATAPLEIQAQACCDPAPCSIDWCSLIVPGLVAAAAGAGTAAAINNKGKHGKHGERGTTGVDGGQGSQGDPGHRGVNPFIRDVDNTLCFLFTISAISFDEGEPTEDDIIAFVSTPDGKLYTAPFDFTDTVVAQTQQICIGSPVFGDYVIGFNIPPTPAVDISFSITASTSDDRNNTTYSPVAQPTIVSIPTSTHDEQVSFDFIYGPVGTVPAP